MPAAADWCESWKDKYHDPSASDDAAFIPNCSNFFHQGEGAGNATLPVISDVAMSLALDILCSQTSVLQIDGLIGPHWTPIDSLLKHPNWKRFLMSLIRMG